MADKLEKELLDIQEKLGGTRDIPPEGTADKLQWHLDKLEELAGGGGSGGVSDVKINGESVTESGQANIITKTPYNASSNPIATMADAGGGSADFDALGQVQVSTSQAGTTVLTFPKQVLPLRLYLEHYQDPISGNEEVYFNYVNNQILNAEGNVISNTSCNIVDEQVVLTFDQAFEFSASDADTLYWVFNNTEDVVESTYDLLHPLPNVTLQDWNKYLHINQSTGKAEWKSIMPEAKQVTGSANTGELYFGRIKPWNNTVAAWRVKYKIEITKKNSNYNASSYIAIVTITDSGYPNSQDACSIIAENGTGSSTQSGYTTYAIEYHYLYAITKAGLNAGCGHLLGASLNVTTNYNYNIYVTVLETDRCDVEIFNALTKYTDIAEKSYRNGRYDCKGETGFQTYPALTVSHMQVSSYSSNNYYVTGLGSTGSPTVSELYWNSGVYINKNGFTANNINATNYVSANSVSAKYINVNTRLYIGGSGRYDTNVYETYMTLFDNNDETLYQLDFPIKNGTLATLDDCGGSIPIDDLTNIPPTPTGPDKLYVSKAYIEGGQQKVRVNFSEQWVPTSLTLEDSATGDSFEVTFNYDADNNTFAVNTTSGFSGYSYVIVGGESYESDFIFVLDSSVSSIDNLTITGTFEYRDGSFDYEW